MKNYRYSLLKSIEIIVLVVFIIFCLIPIVWALFTSLKVRTDILTTPPVFFFKPTLRNYIATLGYVPENARWAKHVPFLHYYMNSLIVSISSTLLSILIGVPAAYFLERRKSKALKNIEFWILSTRMAPPIVFIIPFFMMFNRIRLYDTRIALVVMHLTISLPLIIWLMRNFLSEIPSELHEAAMIDGASAFQSFIRVVVPISLPGLASVVILSFILSWNDLLFGLSLTSRKASTIPVGIQSFIGYNQIYWGQLAASAILAVFPVVIVTLLIGKHIIRGLTLGAIK